MSERDYTAPQRAPGAGAVAVAISVQPHRGTLDARTTREAGVAGQVMPTAGPLVDRYGRVHDDLRISVTDRCNLRCVYCMPEEGMTFLPRAELLSYEEIGRVAQVAHDLGVDPWDGTEFSGPVLGIMRPGNPGGGVGRPLSGHAG